jgi:hypothetical protein
MSIIQLFLSYRLTDMVLCKAPFDQKMDILEGRGHRQRKDRTFFLKKFAQIFCDFKQYCTFAIPIANNAKGKQKSS